VQREWWRRFFAALLALVSFGFAGAEAARESAPIATVAVAELPREARETLALIGRGGPFPYERDGAVFGNFEKLLPPRERGYYREYTVPTPGARGRGARRIVAGGCGGEQGRTRSPPPAVAPCRGGEYYYTDDHYRSFRRIRE
jgi:ribonuclease T1